MRSIEENVEMPRGRQAGVCMHLTSLPGPYGIGEIGASAHAFVDAMRAMGLSVWQFLPIGPTAYGDSPYQSLSTFAGNEMLIDIGELVGMGLLNRGEVDELTTLPDRHVDYGALIPIKTRLLTLAASRFAGSASDEILSDFKGFVERHDERWLHDYALFRVLKSSHGERPWPEWQPEFLHRDPEALAAIETRKRREFTPSRSSSSCSFASGGRCANTHTRTASPCLATCLSILRSTAPMPGPIARSCASIRTADQTTWRAYRQTTSAKTASSGVTPV